MSFLLYSAGASDARNMDSPTLPDAEINRYRALGLAIVIVAAFAGVSMGVALSTWTNTWWIVSLGSVAFAIAIWTIERILTTGLKGKLAPPSAADLPQHRTISDPDQPASSSPDTSNVDIDSDLPSGTLSLRRRLSVGMSILWRFAVATAIGLLVSQPLVAMIFSGPIESQLQSERQSTLADVRRPYQTTLDSLRDLRGAAERSFGERLDSQRERLRCYQELRTAEISGAKMSKCGFTTSGTTGNGTKTKALDTLAASVEEDLDALQDSANTRLTRLDAQRRRVRGQMQQAVAQRRQTFKASLLTQLRALEEVSQEEPLIRYAHWLLFAALCLLDTLPVLVKVQIGGGPYDRYVAQEDALHALGLEEEGRLQRSKIQLRAEAEHRIEATRVKYQEARSRLRAQMDETLQTITEAGDVLQEGVERVTKYIAKIEEANPPQKRELTEKLITFLDELLHVARRRTANASSDTEDGGHSSAPRSPRANGHAKRTGRDPSAADRDLPGDGTSSPA